MFIIVLNTIISQTRLSLQLTAWFTLGLADIMNHWLAIALEREFTKVFRVGMTSMYRSAAL